MWEHKESLRVLVLVQIYSVLGGKYFSLTVRYLYLKNNVLCHHNSLSCMMLQEDVAVTKLLS